MRTRMLDSLAAIEATRWNALDLKGNPFLRHEFLATLEGERCAHRDTGWVPRHLIVEEAGELLGAMPLYLKLHSWGEFVFDWGWANAYTRAGLPYYPKLVSAIPFTPATGPRFLCSSAADGPRVRTLLLESALELAQEQSLSSLHVLFPDEADRQTLDTARLISRRDCQFHWHNLGYTDFEAFLGTFRADKRKKAHRERRRITEAGIEFRTLHGADVDPSLWDVIHTFSAHTFHRHGHEHYLTAAFFKQIAKALPAAIMVKLALYRGQPAAAAIFFVGSDTLYGRYWGSAADFDSLHFETCYYQGIEYCIERGLTRFEPGTQGEHKVPRGFVPALVRSSHWIANERFARAIGAHLEQEGIAVDDYVAGVREHLPFRQNVLPDGYPEAEPEIR